MAKKAPLPKISGCFAPAPRPVSLNDHRITQALFVFLLLGFLCLAHVYLRFSITDIRLEHRQLQEQNARLQQRLNFLQHQSEKLCDSGYLRDYGLRTLGMVESDPRTHTVAAVPASISDKYLKELGPVHSVTVATSTEADPAEGGLQKFILSLVDANQAFASSGRQ
jgi:hypothetical protein